MRQKKYYCLKTIHLKHFRLWAGLIDDVNRGTDARGLTLVMRALQVAVRVHGSGCEDAVDLSDSDSGSSETSLIPAPYSFEPIVALTLSLNTILTLILILTKTCFQIYPSNIKST